MSEEEIRKLAAIMFTDMVGYSALSQRDDKLALQLLEEHRQLLRQIFPRFHGTEIKTIGDAFLVEFNSALEAAQCAIEIQRSLTKRNSDIPPDRRIELKIGIHIGDVVHRGGDVYGDGVNIASRIEPLAGAGGICLSMDVERQIRNAVETRLEKLGPTELKNISVPMELFRIVLPWEQPTASVVQSEVQVSKSQSQKSPRPIIVACAVGAAFLAAGLLGYTVWRGRTGPANRQSESAGGSAVPSQSIAVLPFQNLSDDKANAYFTDGIQDEILTRLSKIAALKVISRTSTSHLASSPQNLPQIARQLGVANVLEGSVQKVANAVHINVQLIRAASDEHLWAESYDRKLNDVFGVEAEVATAIAEQLNAKLSGAEQKAVTQKPTQNAAAYDAYLRAVSIDTTRTDDAAIDEEASSLTTAVRLDPKFALAWARLAGVRSRLYFNGTDLKTNSAAAVKAAADQAMALQPELGESHIAQGLYRYRVLRDFQGALQSYGEALKRLPNDAYVLEQMALVERRLGQWAIAEDHYRRAVDLDPKNVDYLTQLATYFADLRKFAEAESVWNQILQVSPGDEVAFASKALLYQQQGRLDASGQELARIKPDSRDTLTTLAKSLQLEYERRYDDAIAAVQGAPSDFKDDARAIITLGWLQLWAGHKQDAPATFERAISVIKPNPGSVVAVDSRILRSFLAWAYTGLGEKEKALQEARASVTEYKDDALQKPPTEMWLACIQGYFGDADSAIAALPHLLEVPGGITRGQLRIDPIWDPLRKDPRFQKLCQEPNK